MTGLFFIVDVQLWSATDVDAIKKEWLVLSAEDNYLEAIQFQTQWSKFNLGVSGCNSVTISEVAPDCTRVILDCTG